MTKSFFHSFKNSYLALAFTFLSACQSTKTVEQNPNSNYAATLDGKQIAADASPELLNLSELTTLLKTHGTDTSASAKANKLFSSPFIDNSAYRKNGIPKHQYYPSFGEALRISSWNVEKSIHIGDLAKSLQSEDHFKTSLKPKALEKDKIREAALRQRAMLAASDVLLCQEMDIGHCRSSYLFAAKELARSLDMNFVYAPQQLELDPVYLGATDVEFDNKNISTHGCEISAEHAAKYKGVFGVAVLSRYPIKRVQVHPLKSAPYDWYTREIKKTDFAEKIRRFSSQTAFHFSPVREVKTGGRGFTRVDLHIPDLPHETLSVINIHLEIKATPQQRLAQLKEILETIKHIENPVVMAGDFNNASRDLSATSIKKASVTTASDPRNILTTALQLANATFINQLRNAFNGIKNFKNPLAWNIPAILPNKKKSLFSQVRNFRFEDQTAFDFRGNKARSTHGNAGTLSNSNQRTWYKGFTSSFSVPRPIGPIGRDRLDWIFVKSFLSHPTDQSGSYRLAPHFGETLSLLNTAVQSPYSDHHPITTLLPFKEPTP